jgi:teichuronic acid biosynthesis glycosyltransferase TuaC
MGKTAAVGGIFGRSSGAGVVLPMRAIPPSASRVLFVIPGEAQGSSMIFARRQADSLAREGVEVQLFHLRSRTSARELAREWRRFRRCVRRTDPQVVHAHFGTVTALFAALAAPRKPLVITFRGSDLNPCRSAAGRGIQLRALAGRILSQLAALRAARIVCVSRQLRERLWWRRRKVVVLPSGVDPEIFRPESRLRARARLGWGAVERVVLFNAGHDPANKRLDLASRALALTQAALGGVRMHILDGGTAPASVPDLLNAADCLLLTSDVEGSPTVIQEALACNLPVVSVEVGDTAERLRGVSCSAIVPRDAAALATALVQVLRIPSRSNGRNKVPEFSAQRIAGELSRIYTSLGAGGADVGAGRTWNISHY